jgi:hypothetical protein
MGSATEYKGQQNRDELAHGATCFLGRCTDVT